MGKEAVFSDNSPIEFISAEDLSLHPVALLFPELSGYEFKKLVNDIRAKGQIDAVWITSENEIFDGRHRWKAQKELGNKVMCRRLKNFKPELLSTIIEYAISQNLNRRQLSPSQRALIAATLEDKRVKAITQQESGNLSLDGGSGFAWKNEDELTKKFNVSKSRLNTGKRLVKHARQDVLDAVNDGRLPIDAAARTVSNRTVLTDAQISEALTSKEPESVINHHFYAKTRADRARLYEEHRPTVAMKRLVELSGYIMDFSQLSDYEIESLKGDKDHYFLCFHYGPLAIQAIHKIIEHADRQWHLEHERDEAQAIGESKET